MKILVTGATGKVGSEVARSLLRQNATVILAARDVVRTVAAFNGACPVRLFDAYQHETWTGALDGIDRLFLLGTEGADSAIKWKLFIDEAVRCGVKHIAFLSSMGAELKTERPQRLVEMHLQQSGISHTILRPNFFFQNFSTDEAASIHEGEIFLPCGNGKTSFVDTRDIAAVTAMEFLRESPLSRVIHITGSEALDHFEVADIFSEVLGRKITYTNPSNESYEELLKNEGMSDGSIKGLLWLYDTVKEGKWSAISDDFENVTGRKSTLLKQFVQDYRNVWE